MNDTIVHGKTLDQWRAELPLMGDLLDLKETKWFNPAIKSVAEARRRSG